MTYGKISRWLVPRLMRLCDSKICHKYYKYQKYFTTISAGMVQTDVLMMIEMMSVGLRQNKHVANTSSDADL